MKRIIFSHESDIDGMGSIVLSNIAFDSFDYELFPNVNELEVRFRYLMDNNLLDKYDEIYITDLSLLKPSIDMVNKSDLKNKVKIFDHHQRAIDEGLDKYSFSTIIEKENDKKMCATSIYYNYLVENNLIDKNDTLDEFSEMVRLEDTWSWEKFGDFGIKSHDLAILFNAVGIDNYITNLVSKIKNDDLSFNSSDVELINNKKEEYNNKTIEYINNSCIFIDELGNSFGITYAPYEYRNEITKRIINDGNKDDISYMIVVAYDKGDFGQKSYRSVKPGFDVNEVAKEHGGGGHPGAAAVYITKDQKEEASKMDKIAALEYLAKSIYKE